MTVLKATAAVYKAVCSSLCHFKKQLLLFAKLFVVVCAIFCKSVFHTQSTIMVISGNSANQRNL